MRDTLIIAPTPEYVAYLLYVDVKSDQQAGKPKLSSQESLDLFSRCLETVRQTHGQPESQQ